jgi:hypothetical protein
MVSIICNKQLGVLADKIRRGGRPELLPQGTHVAAGRFAGQRHAAPVAVGQFAAAAVAHPRQIRHGLGIILPHVGRVNHHPRFGADAPGGLRDGLRLHLATQLRHRQMPAQTFLGLLERDRFGQRAGDAAHFAVLTGRDAQKHLLNELGDGLGKMGGNYPRKLVNRDAQFLGDFGGVPGALRGWQCWLSNIKNSAPAAATTFPLAFQANKLAIRPLQKTHLKNWG